MTTTAASQSEMRAKDNFFSKISERLKTQDNRMTAHPMFCVQEKVRDVGFDTAYSDKKCWRDSANDETIYDDAPDFKEPPQGEEWEEFGYRDRWETVMVAFTEEGCKEYLRLNGHNHRRETRIYVESYNRCPEMIAIREALLSGQWNTRPREEALEESMRGTIRVLGLSRVALTFKTGECPPKCSCSYCRLVREEIDPTLSNLSSILPCQK